jgi:hypothetical protein
MDRLRGDSKQEDANAHFQADVRKDVGRFAQPPPL